MKRCTLEKIASVTSGLRLDRHAVLGPEIPAEAGAVIAARVIDAKTAYDKLEDVHGRMVKLHPGDVIAGALGHRDALHGYSGHVPDSVAPGDELQLLNVGGVIGTGAEATGSIGAPFRLEVLGAVLRFPHLDRRVGVPARVGDASLEAPALCVAETPPVIALVGTCMNSGKTTAACALIAKLSHRGLRVAAGKLTGVSARRDVLEMEDAGAAPVRVFTDFGVVTTDASNALGAARSIVASLARSEPRAPDVIVLEFGDGLLGTYGVDAVLADAELRGTIAATVLCAQDPVGAWGGERLLAERYGLRPTLVSGPVTDSVAGRGYCGQRLGVGSWNALREEPLPEALLAAATARRGAVVESLA